MTGHLLQSLKPRDNLGDADIDEKIIKKDISDFV
jgi:hypothetical protein